MSAIEDLVTELSRLPTIGRKSALRLTFHLLKLPPEDALPLAQALIDVKETVHFCSTCFNLTEQELFDYYGRPFVPSAHPDLQHQPGEIWRRLDAEPTR